MQLFKIYKSICVLTSFLMISSLISFAYVINPGVIDKDIDYKNATFELKNKSEIPIEVKLFEKTFNMKPKAEEQGEFPKNDTNNIPLIVEVVGEARTTFKQFVRRVRQALNFTQGDRNYQFTVDFEPQYTPVVPYIRGEPKYTVHYVITIMATKL